MPIKTDVNTQNYVTADDKVLTDRWSSSDRCVSAIVNRVTLFAVCVENDAAVLPFTCLYTVAAKSLSSARSKLMTELTKLERRRFSFRHKTKTTVRQRECSRFASFNTTRCNTLVLVRMLYKAERDEQSNLNGCQAVGATRMT
eukprot:6957-Heterococcus_DN1.PRE.2